MPQAVNEFAFKNLGTFSINNTDHSGILATSATPPLLEKEETSEIMRNLWRLSTRPQTFGEVDARLLRSLVEAWVDLAEPKAVRCSPDTVILKVHPLTRDTWGIFCLYKLNTPSDSTFGYLSDRDVDVEWPSLWLDYEKFKDKAILDHCCGAGARVRALRGSGFKAFGCDVIAFDSPYSEIVFSYGRLPFGDAKFGLVESRFGVFFTSAKDIALCKREFSELVRVTQPKGIIRIHPISDCVLEEVYLREPHPVALMERFGESALFIKF